MLRDLYLEEDLVEEIFLVIGGCGFVGSNLVRSLLSRGAKCFVLDNLFTGKVENIPDSENVELCIGCLTDEALLRSLLPRCNRVIHCGVVNIIAAQNEPEKDLMVSGLGTMLIARLCTEYKNITRLVYTSSASVYGNSTELPLTETSSVSPSSYYAVSKLAGEHYAMLEWQLNNTPVTIVRYSNVYGPYALPSNPYSGVVTKFFQSAFENSVVRVHGTGLQTRDFTYVQDAVDATIMAAVDQNAIGEIFNIGTGVETSVSSLALTIIEKLDVDATVHYIEKRQIDNIQSRRMDFQKISRMLNWNPRYSLDFGLERTLTWLLEQATANEVTRVNPPVEEYD